MNHSRVQCIMVLTASLRRSGLSTYGSANTAAASLERRSPAMLGRATWWAPLRTALLHPAGMLADNMLLSSVLCLSGCSRGAANLQQRRKPGRKTFKAPRNPQRMHGSRGSSVQLRSRCLAAAGAPLIQAKLAINPNLLCSPIIASSVALPPFQDRVCRLLAQWPLSRQAAACPL